MVLAVEGEFALILVSSQRALSGAFKPDVIAGGEFRLWGRREGLELPIAAAQFLVGLRAS
jgi:hypothetical protein